MRIIVYIVLYVPLSWSKGHNYDYQYIFVQVYMMWVRVDLIHASMFIMGLGFLSIKPHGSGFIWFALK